MVTIRRLRTRAATSALASGSVLKAAHVRIFCIATLELNVLNCRAMDLDWRLSRVYFLAFLNPSRGQPDPALTVRLASPATVDEPTTELD